MVSFVLFAADSSPRGPLVTIGVGLLVAAAILAVLAFSQRRLWQSAGAWQYRYPAAHEPSDAAYTAGSIVFGVLALIAALAAIAVFAIDVDGSAADVRPVATRPDLTDLLADARQCGSVASDVIAAVEYSPDANGGQIITNHAELDELATELGIDLVFWGRGASISSYTSQGYVMMPGLRALCRPVHLR